MVKILDCTLRDGGYYTNWDFSKELVRSYIEAFNRLPAEYLEVGYRSPVMPGYLGEYFYCPPYVLEEIKSISTKKLVVILNEKDVRAEQADALLTPVKGLVDMVRLAIDPKSFGRALKVAKAVKHLGFEVGFNVMYMSKWGGQGDFLQLLPEIKGIADYFYMVDSYGGVYPDDVRNTYHLVKSKVDVPIGFHGHNNMELGLINTLTAMDCGAEIVDATVTGMGRGAGNLKTELLLTALQAKGQIELDFDALSKVVDGFTRLQEEYGWGTNLPYMVSGANSLPQKDVMEWVGKRFYSFNSIIRALHNQARGVQDNTRLPALELPGQSGRKVLIIGGGPAAVHHSDAIRKYLSLHPETVVVHASSKNAMAFKGIANRQIFCLVGNEGHRMESVFSGDLPESALCVLPPFPRKMGTYIPHKLVNSARELNSIAFTDKYTDSHTAIALQTCIELGAASIGLVGYDGYAGHLVGLKEQELFQENEYLFKHFASYTRHTLTALTHSAYSILAPSSIYASLHEPG